MHLQDAYSILSMTNSIIKAGIIGGAGYTGGELIRILLNHPNVELAFVQSSSNAGNPIHKVHADLFGDTEITFVAKHHYDIDVLFFCAGHGEAKKFVAANAIPSHVRLIDIGNDFRLTSDSIIGDRTFVYGLPELNSEAIRSAENIANPGCFATAIQLGLLPLADAGLLTEVYTTGITGSTGAGQSLSATSHFSWRTNNIQAYKTLTHQHNSEIVQSLVQLQPNLADTNNGEKGISFVPWRGDFARGIFISSTITSYLSLAEMQDLYSDYYKDAAFTFVTTEPVFLKQVVNSNKCIIQIEKVGNKFVIHSVIDNLLKGASGQAVQNMNLIFDLPETTGLKLKTSAF